MCSNITQKCAIDLVTALYCYCKHTQNTLEKHQLLVAGQTTQNIVNDAIF